MGDRKRLIFTAIAVALMGIVTGLLLGGALLPSQAADQQYNERTTTTTTVTKVVHTHDGLPQHTHTITTEVTTTETTPHGYFHNLASTIASGTTKTASTPTQATTEQGADEVLIYGRSYMPVTITVPVGTTVTWTNRDGVEHTVTSDDGLFDAILQGGDTFSYTFNERGTYTYSCLPHPEMFGRVIVE